MVSIVIPIYNEESCLEDLFQALSGFTQNLKEEWEVIFVDDHSLDGTKRKLKEFCSAHSHFKMIQLSKNSGSHVAIIAGLSHSRGDCAVYLSADLQDPPALINQMLQEWKKGFDIVWAVRERREGISLFERMTSGLFHIIFNSICQVQQPPGGSDFALLDRKVIKAVIDSARSNLNLNPLIASRGFDAVCVPYTKKGRAKGVSKWTLSKKIKNFIDALSGYSYVPLRAMSISGVIVSLTGLGYALFLISRYFFWGVRTPEGWSSLMVVLLIVSGLQMIMLGFLGEYLWRTFEAAKNVPLFFIQESVGLDTQHERKKY